MERMDRETFIVTRGTDCPEGAAWAVVASPGAPVHAVCDKSSLLGLGADAEASSEGGLRELVLEQSPLDHVLYEETSGQSSPVEVVAYANLGDPSSSLPFLKTLLSLVEALQEGRRPGRVVLRHGHSGSTQPAQLAGFGVELLAKSADETTKSAEALNATMAKIVAEKEIMDCVATVEEAEADPAEAFNGLNLHALASRFPETKQALCSVRGDLRSAVEEPPPPWTLKRLGARATLNAVRTAERAGGLAGLAAMEEAAQDFKSGWAHALSVVGADEEETVRNITDQARFEEKGRAGTLDINGWEVPGGRRGVLALMQAHVPLISSLELLGRAGLREEPMTEWLRDSRPRAATPQTLDAPDPRLIDFDAGLWRQGIFVFFDARVDPAFDRARQELQQMEADGDFEPNSLVPLARNYGRFWTFPPPVPRALLSIGLNMNPCDKEQMQELARDFVWPVVLWVRFATEQANLEQTPGVALLLGGLAALSSQQEATVLKKLLSGWASGAKDLCDGKAEDRLRTTWKKMGMSPSDLQPISEFLGNSEEATERSFMDFDSLPVPSWLVNGKLVQSSELQGAAMKQVDTLVGVIRYGGLHWILTDQEIVKFQLGEGKPLRSYHPSLTSGRPAYVTLMPAELQGLPSVTSGEQSPSLGVPVAAFVLLLGDSSSYGIESRYAEVAATFLGAFMLHMKSRGPTSDDGTPVPISRWLGIAVAGSCNAHSELTMSGALGRCLSAAAPAGATARSATGALLGVVEALLAVSKNDDATASSLLHACDKAAAANGWVAPLALRKSDLLVGREDALACDVQRPVLGAMAAPPAGAAAFTVNGRLFSPVEATDDGVSFKPGHVALAEELELLYGPRLRGPLARAPWPEGDDVVGAWSGRSSMRALQNAGAGDVLVQAYALGVRAAAVDRASAWRRSGEGEANDEPEPETQELAKGEEGLTGAEQSFVKAPAERKLHIPARRGEPCPFRIFAVLDPLSQDAQQLPGVLRLFHNELNAEVGIVLRPRLLVAQPLDALYRAALVVPPPAGGLAALGAWDGSVPKVEFTLPQRKRLLLSAQLKTPASWHCSAVDSGGADLDSLSADMTGAVSATYSLEALFLEGFASMDRKRGRGAEAAAGRQLALEPLAHVAEDMAGSDSVVVKSGYFQLRAPPGIYRLALHSSQPEVLATPSGVVPLLDLAGPSTFLRAHVRVADEGEKAAAAESSSSSDGFEGSGGDRTKCPKTVHIFSVASGHRYERLLRIMILSVRKHTDCPLRFWLVDNFLSPNFRNVLPKLAEEIGFAVSSVTYKWPAWLREQTQKQRIIWAYKILFLDVFFPRQVERVLFIDADQIVRADVRELWEIDLKQRVYGFVPFCGSGPETGSGMGKLFNWGKADLRNPDTTGFRFWEQGFWRDHLGSSRYYHISALFVVDLARFRNSGAGDMLRDTYQQLTADPHSLANLDQDLPNYAQGMLPIFSLPQEWLWCETWCSEASKEHAKTIDMCQNPLKKEGKLDGARRIAPEWSAYDAYLQGVLEKITGVSNSTVAD